MRSNLLRSVFAFALALAFITAAPVAQGASSGGAASSYCTISFDANGGTGKMSDQIVTPGVMFTLRKNAFKRKGYAFVGWAPFRSGAVVVGDQGSGTASKTGFITLYAQWKKSKTNVGKFKVKFNPNGGKGKMAAQTIARNKAVALRKNAFTRKGCIFLGWAKKKTGAVAYKNGAKVKNLAAKGKTASLYAKWAKKKYNVAFHANGGKGKMAKQKMAYGKAAKLKANKFTAPKGKVFKGWAKSKALAKKGKVAYKNKQAVKNLTANGGTVTLYAVWKKKPKDTGTVTFVFHVTAPDVKGSTPNLTLAKDEKWFNLAKYNVENGIKRDHYIFDYWYWPDGPGGKGNSYNHFSTFFGDVGYFYNRGFRTVHLYDMWSGPYANY